jgi:hypothetical protein
VDSLIGPIGQPLTTASAAEQPVANPVTDTPKEINLKYEDFVLLDIEPLVTVSYSKDVQTEGTSVSVSTDESPTTKSSGSGDDDFVSPISLAASTGRDMVVVEEEVLAIRELTEDEVKATLSSATFTQFLDKSAKYVERSLNLNDDYDILIDYSKTDEEM